MLLSYMASLSFHVNLIMFFLKGNPKFVREYGVKAYATNQIYVSRWQLIGRNWNVGLTKSNDGTRGKIYSKPSLCFPKKCTN